MKFLKYFFFNINKKIKIGSNLKSGRNYLGTICVHHRFGGNKIKKYNIDWYRRIENFGFLYKILVDANRTAFIGGVIYENGLFTNILLSENIRIGQKLYSGILNKDVKAGYTCLLANIKLFSIINNVEIYPNKGFALSRSAGSSSLLTSVNKNIATLKLKSGYNLYLSIMNLSNFGSASNVLHKFNNLKKAGKSWSMGRRPSVRGVAMNPCDHPHGGGEGKKSPPKAQRSPWGWLTKGTPSIKKKYIKRKKMYRKIK
jgi:large subunit ribosomal protein L2